MTANIGLKYPLCVEWNTELPFERTPRKSTSISLWGSEWFLEFERGSSMGDFTLYLHNINSLLFYLDKVSSVTTSLGCGARSDVYCSETQLLTDQKYFRKSGDALWHKTREQVVSEIPNIFFTGKVKIFCIFESIQIDVEKTLVVRQMDSASPIRYSVISRLQCLSRDFSAFLKDVTFSDVKLICSDRIFSAHRLVLAACSEVFADMFHDKMAEKETGTVDIKDVDPCVLELVLQYMYSGRSPELNWDMAYRLYKAAHRYAVHGLKQACSFWMLENHNPKEFLDLVVLAEEHSDKDFLVAAVRYAAKNPISLNDESWSAFKKKYPQLALLVLETRLVAQ